MRCLNRIILLFVLFIGSGLPASAQNESGTGDSVIVDSTIVDSTIIEAAPSEEPAETTEEVQPVIYNESAPTPSEWNAVTNDKDFGYKDKREFTVAEERKYEEPWLFKFLDKVITFFSSPAGKIILWSLLVFLVGYIVVRIVSGGWKIFGGEGKIKKPGESGSVSEEDLAGQNWEERMHAAIDAGDIRMAIRYSYIWLLKLLQERELIAYRQDKTNIEYYRELTIPDMRPSFRSLTREYEYAWYGNFIPSAPAFETYMQTFNSIKNKLQS